MSERTIPLSLEPDVDVPDWSGIPGYDGYSVPTGTDVSGAPTIQKPAALTVEFDVESDRQPPAMIWLMFFTDNEPWFRLTIEEAGLLHDRLGEVLGRDGSGTLG